MNASLVALQQGASRRPASETTHGGYGLDTASLAIASAADHPAIQHFLSAVFSTSSRDVFLQSLDDPFYEPSDRVLVRRDARLLGHVHLTKRVAQFGAAQIPVSGLHHLALHPELRGQGVSRQLLARADELMAEDGSLVGLLVTRTPRPFQQAGWAICGRHSYSRGDTRRVMAQLARRGVLDAEGPLSVRPWRQVEMPGLLRVYQESLAGRYGLYDRTEAYWRWLVSRKRFEQVYVALDGPTSLEFDEACDAMVGFAVARDDCVLELHNVPGRRDAALRLLAHCAGEAIERDQHRLGYHGPVDDPVHGLFVEADGTTCSDVVDAGEVYMVKVVDPRRLLDRIAGELFARAVAARLPRPCELGLVIGERKYSLIVSRRSVKVVAGRAGRVALRLDDDEFARLALGHLDLKKAAERGRVKPSSRGALQIGRGLFPQLPWWRAPLDRLED